MDATLDTLLALTEQAAAIPRRHFRAGLPIDAKPDDTLVTLADRETEAFLRDRLAAAFPGSAILGEEYGETAGDTGDLWVIDPIDGTRAFVTGLPLYGMLVALLRDATPVLGVVRMPELGEVFYGSAAGAFLNGRRLATSGCDRPEEAFLYINEADKILSAAPEAFERLSRTGRDRRFAYDCYPHALVAAGHADACVDYHLQPYDYLALVPLIEAAGGVITDWQGAPLGLTPDTAVVSAATPALHAALLDRLNGA